MMILPIAKLKKIWGINKYGEINSFWTGWVWAILKAILQMNTFDYRGSNYMPWWSSNHHSRWKNNSKLMPENGYGLTAYVFLIMKMEFWESTKVFPTSSHWIPKAETTRKNFYKGNVPILSCHHSIIYGRILPTICKTAKCKVLEFLKI